MSTATLDLERPAMAEPVATSPTPVERELPLTTIERRPGWHLVNVRELWRSREVLYYLAWRDIKVRFKQTILGVGWAFAQPLMAMFVFAIFFGGVGGMGAEVENYALFVFAGMLPWTFFSSAITQAGNSVVANERLITKVYFPRLLVPFSSVGSVLFDFVIAMVLLGAMMAIYGVLPTWRIVFAPVAAFLLVLAAMGIGSLLSALIAVQRDFRYILNFAVQVWLFATPAIYRPLTSMGELSQTWVPLNPVHGLIENFRQAVLGGPMNWYSFAVSGGVTLFFAVFGLAYFRRMERTFADVI